MDPNLLDDLAAKLAGALPPALNELRQDVEKNFRAVLHSAFAKLELVTREEFEVQAQVLARTRARLEALEREVTELEARLLDRETHE